MKKTLFTVALATCFAGTSHAQLHSHSDSYVGVKVGGTAASFNGDDTRFLRYVFGANAGVFANLALASPFSLQPELLFSMKGTKGQAGVSDESTRLNYLDLPVALRASFSDLYVEAGPQVGLLLTAKSDVTSESVKSSFRTVDVGYILGVGYQPHLGGLGIGARFNAGFLSVTKTPIGRTEPLDIHNEIFQVSLTYSAQKIHKNRKRKDPS